MLFFTYYFVKTVASLKLHLCSLNLKLKRYSFTKQIIERVINIQVLNSRWKKESACIIWFYDLFFPEKEETKKEN